MYPPCPSDSTSPATAELKTKPSKYYHLARYLVGSSRDNKVNTVEEFEKTVLMTK